MWAPIAALLLIIGAVNSPAMFEAERQYAQHQTPTFEVQDSEATEVDVDSHQAAAGIAP